MAAFTNLHPRFERQESIARVAHLENSSEFVLCKITDLENLKVRRYGSKIHFVNKNLIDDDWWLG